MAPFVEYSKKIAIWWYALVMIQPANAKDRRIDLDTLNEESSALISEIAPRMGCWMFLHMPKSGGTTMKTMLRKAANTNNIRHAALTNNQFVTGASGRRDAENVRRAGQGVVYGGYIEALRAYVSEDKCKWFTVFRHPVTRLLSAFFFRTFKRRNELNTNEMIDLDAMDIFAFAEYWGNYGLRQFVLSFHSADDILSSAGSQMCKGCEGWYMFKRYLEELQQQSPTDGTIAPLGDYQNDDNRLYRFLEPALDIINSKYAAVGILEDMNTTMHLFDRALGMPNFSWPVEIQKVGASNSNDKMKAQAHDAWLRYSTDPSLLKFIWLDMILYQHALNVHAKQVKQYGLE